MRTRIRMLVVCVGVVLLQGVLAAVIPERLVVRIYDGAGLAPDQRAGAIANAQAVLAALDVEVVWHHCDARAGTLEGWCATPTGPGELVVRLVRAPQRTGARAVLGNAFVGAVPGQGTLATVFIDRIESVAGLAEAEPWPIAGRVIAHEIGHLLLGSNSHSEHGLMRNLWRVEDLAGHRPADWTFSSAERERMRSGLSGLIGLTGAAPRV